MDRAPYAARPDQSLGRLLAEPSSPTRSDFQRDRDRIIHSTAFRRLAHKTQVFVPHEGDHYRTRLTHSIEVGQLARALARSLRLDEDLAEAIALAHDLGHTPFGHTGEDVLDRLMKDHGGFDHNAQTLRVVTKLERRYAAFDGLNLTYETLEGLAKHNGPLLGSRISAVFLELDQQRPLGLDTYATAEAQCAAIADDIAYNAHDLDDGLRGGLFSLEACHDVPLLAANLREIAARHPDLERPRIVYELTRRIITHFVEDATAEAKQRLAACHSLRDVRTAGVPVIAFSEAARDEEAAIKHFLWGHMYRHRDIVSIRERAAGVVSDLFRIYRDDPAQMPADRPSTDLEKTGRLERVVCDYIAGMTDRFALAEHRRLFPTTPELRYRPR